MDDAPRPLPLRTRTLDDKCQDYAFGRRQPQNDAGHSLALTAADAADGNVTRRLPYQQRSLAHHPTLRRKPSELHLRSSAIARLGIPEAEVRLALEASRARGALRRSVSDLNLDERRSTYPSEFDHMPYDHQGSRDDQIINQLLLEWTAQGASGPRRDERAETGTGQGTISGDEPVDSDDQSTSSVIKDDYGFSEESTSGDNISKTPNVQTPGGDLQAAASAETDPIAELHDEKHIQNEARLVWGNNSTVEIEKLEKQLATLKFMRNAKRTGMGLLSKVLNEKAEHRTGDRLAAGAVQTTKQAEPTTAEQDGHTGPPSEPKMPTVQRRVTMDEVEDEADTKKPTGSQPPVAARDGDEGGTKPTHAPTFLTPVQTSEGELEWAQRVLQDSVALCDPARAETVLGSQSRRDVRAAHREASRRDGPDRSRRRNGAADQRVHEWKERQRSRVRSPERVAGLVTSKHTRPSNNDHDGKG